MLLEAVISALVAVETGNHPQPDQARGDGGRALGILQIHAAVVTDVNRLTGAQYAHGDALQPGKARQICRAYLIHYCGKTASAETYAAVWNGGPLGLHKPSARRYAAKVKRQLKEGGINGIPTNLSRNEGEGSKTCASRRDNVRSRARHGGR